MSGKIQALHTETSDVTCASLLKKSPPWALHPLTWNPVVGLQSLLIMHVIGIGEACASGASVKRRELSCCQFVQRQQKPHVAVGSRVDDDADALRDVPPEFIEDLQEHVVRFHHLELKPPVDESESGLGAERELEPLAEVADQPTIESLEELSPLYSDFKVRCSLHPWCDVGALGVRRITRLASRLNSRASFGNLSVTHSWQLQLDNEIGVDGCLPTD